MFTNFSTYKIYSIMVGTGVTLFLIMQFLGYAVVRSS